MNWKMLLKKRSSCISRSLRIYKSITSAIARPCLIRNNIILIWIYIRGRNLTSTIFWDETLCSLVEVRQRFEGMYCLQQQASYMKFHATMLLVACPLTLLIRGQYVPLKHWWTSTMLEGITSQTIVLFIITAMRSLIYCIISMKNK
jgi:hypothetical protein